MPTPPPRLSLWWLRSAARLLAPPVFFLEGKHSSCWGPYVRAKIQKVTMVRPSRQPSVKGERLVLFEVNAVMGMAKATGLRALLGLSPWWLHWMDHVRKIGAGCFLWVQIVYLWLRIRNQKKNTVFHNRKNTWVFFVVVFAIRKCPLGVHNNNKHNLSQSQKTPAGMPICGPIWVRICTDLWSALGILCIYIYS